MYDWLIVGAGIHGTYMARQLCERSDSASIAVLDPAPQDEYTASWKRSTGNVLGLHHLRSNMDRYIGSDPLELENFNPKEPPTQPRTFSAPRFKHLPGSPTDTRPGLSLFNAHVDEKVRPLVSARATWIQALADYMHYDKTTKSFQVFTTNSAKPIEARHVILATGQSEKTRWPDWAEQLSRKKHRGEGWQIGHLFDPTFDTLRFIQNIPPGEPITIVGGGISAMQLASELATTHQRKVVLVTRQPINETQGLHNGQHPRLYPLDFHPAAGKTNTGLAKMFNDTPMPKRAEFNKAYRYPGSYPQDVYDTFKNAMRTTQRIQVVIGEVQHATVVARNQVELNIKPTWPIRNSSKIDALKTSSIILATGFQPKPFEQESGFLGQTVEEMKLPTVDGFPVVDEHLQWKYPGLFVTGALADLGVGPASRNIAGAQLAAPMIFSSPTARKALTFSQQIQKIRSK